VLLTELPGVPPPGDESQLGWMVVVVVLVGLAVLLVALRPRKR
jgi:hypothetical protein